MVCLCRSESRFCLAEQETDFALQPVVLVGFWIILKILRFFRDDFEWCVTLGSWEELQSRLDRLASAIVTDAPVPGNNFEAGGEVFEMNHLTQSPAPHSQLDGRFGGIARNEDSGYFTPQTGLGVGLHNPDLGRPEASRTPSPRAARPGPDPTSAMEYNNSGDQRRRRAAGYPTQTQDDEIMVSEQGGSHDYRHAALQPPREAHDSRRQGRRNVI